MIDETTKTPPDVTAIATTETTESVETTETSDTTDTTEASAKAEGAGLIKIERVIKKPRIEGLPVIRGGKYSNVPFARDQSVFAVDAVTARTAVRTGSFREVPGGKTRLK